MPRNISPAVLTALQSKIIYPALFLEASFASGLVYIWTGVGTITWNSHVWQGLGGLLGISTIEEGMNTQARGITLSLSGVDQSLLADVLQEVQIGLPVVLYLGLFDGGSPMSLLASPITSWSGRIDQSMIEVSGETATITVAGENVLLMLGVPSSRRYTQDDQQIDAPGDQGFSFVQSIQEQNINWGRVPSSGAVL